MSSTHIAVTLIEFIVFGLLIYGFTHEEKVVAFEENVKRIVIGNYRRFKRIRNERKVAKHNGR